MTRAELIPGVRLRMSTMRFVPFHLSSRCGVWTRIIWLYFTAISTCRSKIATSFRLFLFSPISPMPSNVGPVEELGDDGQHFLRQREVLGLLRIEAEPRIVRQAVTRGPLRLVLGELAKVIVKALG